MHRFCPLFPFQSIKTVRLRLNLTRQIIQDPRLMLNSLNMNVQVLEQDLYVQFECSCPIVDSGPKRHHAESKTQVTTDRSLWIYPYINNLEKWMICPTLGFGVLATLTATIQRCFAKTWLTITRHSRSSSMCVVY